MLDAAGNKTEKAWFWVVSLGPAPMRAGIDDVNSRNGEPYSGEGADSEVIE